MKHSCHGNSQQTLEHRRARSIGSLELDSEIRFERREIRKRISTLIKTCTWIPFLPFFFCFVFNLFLICFLSLFLCV